MRQTVRSRTTARVLCEGGLVERCAYRVARKNVIVSRGTVQVKAGIAGSRPLVWNYQRALGVLQIFKKEKTRAGQNLAVCLPRVARVLPFVGAVLPVKVLQRRPR